MERISPEKAYLLLESGPVILLTTKSNDRTNIMTVGFHMMVQHEPPRIACIVGPWDHSFQALEENGECVIAVPTVDLVERVVDIGNCSGRDLDKFAAFDLTSVAAAHVSAPLIAECYANVECRVIDRSLVRRFNLWVLEADAIWIDRERAEKRVLHHRGDGTFAVDGEVLDLKERMVLWKEFQVDL